MTIQKTIDFDAIFNELKPGDTSGMLGQISNLEYLKMYRTITFGGRRQIGHTRWVEERFISDANYQDGKLTPSSIVVTVNQNFQSMFISNLYDRGIPDFEVRDIAPYVFTLKDTINRDDTPPRIDDVKIDTVYLDNVLRNLASTNVNRLYRWLTQNIEFRDATIVSIING